MYIFILYLVLGIQLVISYSMNDSYFSNAKVGDKVTSLTFGHGEIVSIKDPYTTYPIEVRFYSSFSENFTMDGLWVVDDFSPNLFKGLIDLESLKISYNTLK